MQLQDKNVDVRDNAIRDLQNQVSELTVARLLLEDENERLKANALLLEEKNERAEAKMLLLEEENERLKAELAQKERFAAMIAHELRSPLTPIINYAQIIARPHQRRETIERGSQIIVSQSWRLARLAKDLLDVSRLSTGHFTLKCRPCDLVKIVSDLLEQCKPVAPFHTFQLDLSAAGEALVGNWDRDRLQQAVGNLVDNAIKYSDDGTTITLKIWQTASKACVSVHNAGAGIPKAQVDQLFRPFSRLQTPVLQDGTGLGLFITRSIVEAHGGELRLEELPADQGTTFSFDLPL